jgi:hypothetical protein
MHPEVLFICRLIPGKLGFLESIVFLIPLQSVAFLGLLIAFTNAYDMKVFVARYHSIDMHCIVVPIKVDSGLPISVLKNEQPFTKKLGGSKPISFQKAKICQFSKTLPILVLLTDKKTLLPT